MAFTTPPGWRVAQGGDAHAGAMASPTPLPDDLPVGLRLVDARTIGLTRDVLRGSRFDHLGRDLYRPAADGSLSTIDRCRAVALVIPDDAGFTHATAAVMGELPVPWRFESDELIHVSRARDDIPPSRLGLISHEMELPTDHLTVHQGLRVTTPARTMLDLANDLTQAELVALGDVVIGRELATRHQLEQLATWARGRRGVVRFRQALPLLDGRAESPQESKVRTWLAVCGLPRMVPQLWIRDRQGREITRCDLVNDAHKVVGEYEGSYHRDREQYAADIARRTALVNLGYEVVQVEAESMRDPCSVVDRFVQAFRRHGWTGDYHLGGLTL